MAVATLKLCEMTGTPWIYAAAILFLILVTVVVGLLVARTVLDIARGEICVDEG